MSDRVRTQKVQAVLTARKVQAALIANPNGLKRPELVQSVFGFTPSAAELANDRYDRAVRRAITDLRRMGVLIVATSRGHGYRIATTDEEVDAYIREQISRVVEIQKTVRAVKRANGRKDQMQLVF